MDTRESRFLLFRVFKIGFTTKLLILAMILNMFPLGSAQAVDPPEVISIHFELRPGTADWMWGVVESSASVEVKKGPTVLFEVTADSSGNWENPFPIEVNPGDWFMVTAGEGDIPVNIQVPNPFTSYADSTSNQVWGKIDHLDTEPVVVHGNWDNLDHPFTTDDDGNFTANFVDIPNGGDGHVTYQTMWNYTDVFYHQYFRTPDLILEVNYANDWVQSHYEPGHTVWLNLYDGNGTTLKATAEVETGEIPWWGGGTGFSTDLGNPWNPSRPDIVPGDWVYGEVDNGYDAWVRIGNITGEVDLSADTVSGTVASSWLMPAPVDVECFIWEEFPPDSKVDSIYPDGSDTYNCSWSGEYDIQPNQQVVVSYRDTGGYENPDKDQVEGGHYIYDVYFGYLDDIIMKIHYGYDWIEGYYEPGHNITLTVLDGGGTVKATTTLTTEVIYDWGGRAGFATWLPDIEWVPEHPDIQPGDIIRGVVDDGSEFWDEVKLGLITGEVDPATDSVSGTVLADVNWVRNGIDPVDVGCYIWGEFEPENKFDLVMPDGIDCYACSWSGEWDILIGQQVQVAYFEPEGHEIINNFLKSYLIYLPQVRR
jgi:hypothetical protein